MKEALKQPVKLSFNKVFDENLIQKSENTVEVFEYENQLSNLRNVIKKNIETVAEKDKEIKELMSGINKER